MLVRTCMAVRRISFRLFPFIVKPDIKLLAGKDWSWAPVPDLAVVVSACAYVREPRLRPEQTRRQIVQLEHKFKKRCLW